MSPTQAAVIIQALACGKEGCICHKSARDGHGVTHCPAHDDGSPSLSVSPPDRTAWPLLHCFGGCSHKTVLAALRDRGVLPRSVAFTVGGARHYREDQAGGAKSVRWDSGAASRAALYRAEALDGLAAGSTVVVCEGETAAEAGVALGLTAVGTACGASSVPTGTALEPLRDRDVVLIPDNDDVGRSHMTHVAAQLRTMGISARWLQLGGLPDKGDLADYRGERAELCELVQAAPPWDPPVDDGGPGFELLNAVHSFLARFVSYPSEHEHVAHTLWIAHTHMMDAWDSTPRIAFLSPEPASGKTRALEVTELLVPNPVEAVNVTPAYLFRKVGAVEGAPTILYDEIDTVFGPKAKDNEEIRGLLNAGHRRGAVAGRCVLKGKTIETEEIPAYCAVALAGLGGLPDTILSRAVVVRMKRRAPAERVQAFRRRVHGAEGLKLRQELTIWAAARVSTAGGAWPPMPDGIEDRDADIWEPLLTVADLAGGGWPEQARVAAVTLVTLSKGSTPSLGIRLMEDVRAAFSNAGSEALTTVDLLSSLNGMEDAPWGDLRGKALDARGLSRRLSEYEVTRSTIRMGDKTAKGYRRSDFVDAWARYLPAAAPPQEPVTEVTPEDLRYCQAESCLQMTQLGDWCSKHRQDRVSPGPVASVV